MTDAELAAAKEEIQELREEIREDLAADLDGDPEEYDSEKHFRDLDSDTGEAVPDGGE
ncbi:hypothetical protein [Halobellus ordinarius]|uniref:hypothetical protein n=1 Tax=Halobellus ordinarius TaxID=3075120 RepID=UPI0028804D72|nr:hypothetical protein [Halobellus sp. ZY16]